LFNQVVDDLRTPSTEDEYLKRAYRQTTDHGLVSGRSALVGSSGTRCCILDKEEARPLGVPRTGWLAQSLRAVQAKLEAVGGKLALRRGSLELAQDVQLGPAIPSRL